MPLTAKAISVLQLLPGQNDKIYFDDAMPGFGYRFTAKRRRDQTLLGRAIP